MLPRRGSERTVQEPRQRRHAPMRHAPTAPSWDLESWWSPAKSLWMHAPMSRDLEVLDDESLVGETCHGRAQNLVALCEDASHGERTKF